MKRRDFLRASAAMSTALILPKHLRADDPAPAPLWIHLHAGGGWDPTLLCDPRPEVNQLDFAVGTTTTTNAGAQFSYAAIGGSDVVTGNYSGALSSYGIGNFFETYKNQMLVFNGVNPRTAGHFSGARYAASGRLDPGYPALMALAAALGGADKAMAYLVGASASYSATGGHVAETRLGSTQYLDEALNPNIFFATTPFYSSSDRALLNNAKEARLQRLIANESNPQRQKAMMRFLDARLGTPLLENITAELQADSNIALPNEGTKNRLAHHLFDNGLRAIVGYEQGLTVAATLNAGSFDTHGDHDKLHPVLLQNVLQGIDGLLQEAQLRSVPMVIWVTSEFGRTAGYNVADGKDHWPNTSWMLFQTSDLNLFNAGRTIGASHFDESTWQIHSRKLDPTTLLPTSDENENGVYLTPDLIHLSLREMMGVSQSTYATHLYRIDGTPLNGLLG